MLRLAAILTIVVAGCGSREAYRCASSAQCMDNGTAGVCMAGYCAFPDEGCEGGLRYEPNAGDGLGGTCTSGDAGVAACGVVGQACCTTETTCSDGTCRDGSCASCVGDIAFGRRFSCVLKTDGSVWCAGANDRGQLGFGVAGVGSPMPMQVRDETTALIADAISISAGREHACAVREGGSVWCWGRNFEGQLGDDVGGTSAAAVQVHTTAGEPLGGIVDVRAGYNHTCARDDGGRIWCWGANGNNDLGDGTTTSRARAAPVLVAAMGEPFTGATELLVGAGMSCARKTNGELWCWGNNDDGQFGDGTEVDHPVPVLVGTPTSIAMGHWHTCRVRPDSTIECAGWSGHGRLGHGRGDGFTDGNYPNPVQVLSAPGGAALTGAVALASGSNTCALMQDTTVYCWGDNQYGQNGSGVSGSTPSQVKRTDGTPLRDVDRLVGRWPHMCARTADGAWWCWGRNIDGEFGDGTLVGRPFPKRLEVSCP